MKLINATFTVTMLDFLPLNVLVLLVVVAQRI